MRSSRLSPGAFRFSRQRLLVEESSNGGIEEQSETFVAATFRVSPNSFPGLMPKRKPMIAKCSRYERKNELARIKKKNKSARAELCFEPQNVAHGACLSLSENR